MAAVIRYVDASLTTGSNNGTSWENAYQGAEGLNTALNAVSASFTQVYVKPGVYSKIVVARNYNPVVIESTDGAETTIVDGGTEWDNGQINASPITEGKRCLTITNGTNWTFKGFTFQNGFSKSGDGQTDAGMTGGVYSNNVGRCILKNCIIKDCYAATSKTAMWNVNTYDTEVFNCNGVSQIIDSGTHYDLKVHDCSVSSHSAAIYGGTTYRMEAYRCYTHSTNTNGGIINTGSHVDAHIHDCIAYGNAAETAFTCLVVDATLYRGHVHDCKAQYLFYTSCNVISCRVHDCIGMNGYGGIGIQTCNVSSLFYNNELPNSAENGAFHQPRSMVNCTVTGNVLSNSSQAITVFINATNASTACEFFSGNIIYGNKKSNGANVYAEVEMANTSYGMGGLTMNNCWLGSLSSRTVGIAAIRAGVISRSTNLHIGENPKFLDPANDLYCLAPDSPCIGIEPYDRQYYYDCRYAARNSPLQSCGAYEHGATIYCDPSPDRDEWASRGSNNGVSWDSAFYGEGCLDRAIKIALPYDRIVLVAGEYEITGSTLPCVIEGVDGKPDAVVVHCRENLSAFWSSVEYKPGFKSMSIDGDVSLSGLSLVGCKSDVSSLSDCDVESSQIVLHSTFSGEFVNCTFRVANDFSGSSLLAASDVSAFNCLFLPDDDYARTDVAFDDANSDSTVVVEACLSNQAFAQNTVQVNNVSDSLAGFRDPNLTKVSALEKIAGSSQHTPSVDLFGRAFSGTEVGCCAFVQSEATTWYCDANLATGRNDGSSWENAFQGAGSMQTAVNSAATGGTILLEDGTYNTTSGGTGLTIRSRNGHANCIVTRVSGGPQQGGTDFVFEGITFRTPSGQTLHVVIANEPKIFRRCVFDGVAGENGLLRQSLAEQCLFVNCTGPSTYALFNSSGIIGCTISNCVWDPTLGILRDNVYQDRAHMFNCVVDSVPSGSVLYTAIGSASSRFAGNVINGIDSPNGRNADPHLDSSFKPTSTSPAIGFGDPTKSSSSIDLDSVQYKEAPTAGCFERDDTVYVDLDATGRGTGKNWEDAFTTIQAGVNAAKDGDFVMVEDGTYYECVEVPTKVVKIHSAHGKEYCIVDASRTCNTDAIANLYSSTNHYKLYNRIDGYRCGRCFSSMAIQGSKHYEVHGFTLTGGHTRTLGRALHLGRQSGYGISSGSGAWGYFFLQDCIVENCNGGHSILCGTGSGAASIDRCIVRDCVTTNTYEGTATMGGEFNSQAATYVSGITNSLFYGIRTYGTFNGSNSVVIQRSYHVSNCTVVPSLGSFYRATNAPRRVAINVRGNSVRLGPAAGQSMGVFNSVVVRDEPIQYGTETTRRLLANSVVSTTGNIEANTTITDVVYQNDVLDANFRPRRNSPAIGLSNQAYVYGTTDLEGNPRKEHPAAGCYEAPDVFDPEDTGEGGLYVSSDLATGLGTGTSWANAAKGRDSLAIASELSETPGNVINADDGVYSPVYRFDNRETTFISRNGAENCIVEGLKDTVDPINSPTGSASAWYTNRFMSSCMRLGSSSNSKVKVIGFTLRNGMNPLPPINNSQQNVIVYNDGGGVVYGTLEDCVFENCCAMSRASQNAFGGAAVGATLKRCTIRDCWSAHYGGGIYNCTADACLFERCYALRYDGGAAYLDNASRILTGCTFRNCRARRHGVVRSTTAITDQFVNCTFIGNRSGINSIIMEGGNACGNGGRYIGCKFIRNTNWGTVESTSNIVGSLSLVKDCLFEYNTCYYGCIQGGTVENCILRYNTANFSVMYGSSANNVGYYTGLLIYDNLCGSILGRQFAYNCTLYRNSCSNYITNPNGDSNTRMCNCLVVDNMPRNSTVGTLSIKTGTSGVYCNNVVRGATFETAGTISGNVIVPVTDSIGVVDLSKPDLHLVEGSPAIGAGSSEYLKTTTDLDGVAWAAVPAVGCYEFRPYSQAGLPNLVAPFGSLETKLLVGAKRYCTRGLSLMWDGIENAGYGVHDSSATKWKALVGGSLWDATLSSVGSFDDNSLVCAGGERSDGKSMAAAWTAGSGSLTTSNVRTIEVCYRLDSAWGRVGTSGTQGPQFVFSARLGSAANSGKRTIAYTSANTSNYQKVSVQTSAGAAGSTVDVTQYFQKTITLTAVYTGDNVTDIYLNGVRQTTKEATLNSRNGEANFVTFGGRKDVAYGMSGHIYSVRLYNSALTAQQIADNAMIDRQRFNFQ